MKEIVIKIPREPKAGDTLTFYENIDGKIYAGLDGCVECTKKGMNIIAEKITVLPKGHGRLIDADAFIGTLDASDRDIYCEQAINEDAPTLVEADKENENDV